MEEGPSLVNGQKTEQTWWQKIKSRLVVVRRRWLSFRQKIQQHLYATVVVVLLVLILFILLAYGFGWGWTGFNGGYPKITTTMMTPGTTVATEQQPAKTLWDWLGLLAALAVPVVVGFGVAWFTRTQQLRDQEHEKLQRERDQQFADQRAKSEQEAAEKRAQTEREIASDNQQEAALQAYIDKMSELLLKQNLGELRLESEESTAVEQKPEATPEAMKQEIMRIRTLTTLVRVDPRRKGSVLQFLYRTNLIRRDGRIVNLQEADLTYINLSGADLTYINLSGADLTGANLVGVNLVGADLSEAVLISADLSNANLSEVDLTEADLYLAKLTGAQVTLEQLGKAKIQSTILPNGSTQS